MCTLYFFSLATVTSLGEEKLWILFSCTSAKIYIFLYVRRGRGVGWFYIYENISTINSTLIIQVQKYILGQVVRIGTKSVDGKNVLRCLQEGWWSSYRIQSLYDDVISYVDDLLPTAVLM